MIKFVITLEHEKSINYEDEDLDPYINLDGYFQILINNRPFFNPLNPLGFRVNEFGLRYLVFNVIWSLIEYLESSHKGGYYFIGDSPNTIRVTFLNRNNRVHLFLLEETKEGLTKWYDGEYVFNQEHIPENSKIIIEKEKLIEEVNATILDFYNMIKKNFPSLIKNDVVFKLLKRIEKEIL